MKRFIIKNADGTQQYVMPAVHDTRKKAEETLMGYIHSRNKFTEEYLSLFDFIIEVEKYDGPSKIIPDFEQAKQVIGSTKFILAKDSYCFSGIEFNIIHNRALVALNKLFTIAQAWNMLDNFVPNFSNYEQFKWFPCFEYNKDTKEFVFDKARYTLSYTNAPTQLRLCFRTEKRAEQFGRQFADLYNQVFLL